MSAERVFNNATEIVADAIKRSKKRADLATEVVEALDGNRALAPWPGERFTVWLWPGAERLTITRSVDMPGGVVIDYWGESPVAYRFPAGAEVEVTS